MPGGFRNRVAKISVTKCMTFIIYFIVANRRRRPMTSTVLIDRQNYVGAVRRQCHLKKMVITIVRTIEAIEYNCRGNHHPVAGLCVLEALAFPFAES